LLQERRMLPRSYPNYLEIRCKPSFYQLRNEGRKQRKRSSKKSKKSKKRKSRH
jgi:hypothetical protein